MADLNLDDWVEIGTIVAPQGLNGELRVYPNTDFPERFEKAGQRWLLRPNQTPEPVKLIKGRYVPGKNIYIVKLAEIEDRNQAEELQGCKLMVHQSDRPKLAKDEYHVLDLVNLQVFNQITGESVGIVVDVLSAGNDLLAVKRDELTTEGKQPKNNLLIPFVKEIVPIVDLENGRIEITPPPGLLELE